MIESESTPSYERRDLNVRAIAWFMAGLAVTLAVIFISLHFFQSTLEDGKPKAVHAAPNPAPSPRLESAPSAALAARLIAEEAKMNRYRWVDRKAGVIEIPIERAIELTAQRGLPARTAPASKGGPP